MIEQDGQILLPGNMQFIPYAEGGFDPVRLIDIIPVRAKYDFGSYKDRLRVVRTFFSENGVDRPGSRLALVATFEVVIPAINSTTTYHWIMAYVMTSYGYVRVLRNDDDINHEVTWIVTMPPDDDDVRLSINAYNMFKSAI